MELQYSKLPAFKVEVMSPKDYFNLISDRGIVKFKI